MTKFIAHDCCERIVDIIKGIDVRCMAADGPVTPTHLEITDEELRKIYRLAMTGAKRLSRNSPLAARKGEQ